MTSYVIVHRHDEMIGYSRGPLKGIPIEKRHEYTYMNIHTQEEYEVDWEAEEADPREPFKPVMYVEVNPETGKPPK